MLGKNQAVLNESQVEELKSLFESYDKPFHVQSLEERGKSNLLINIISRSKGAPIVGWNKISSPEFGFEEVFENCSLLLAKVSKDL